MAICSHSLLGNLAQRGQVHAPTRRALRMTFLTALREIAVLPAPRVLGHVGVCCQWSSMMSKYSVCAACAARRSSRCGSTPSSRGHLGHQLVAVARDALAALRPACGACRHTTPQSRRSECRGRRRSGRGVVNFSWPSSRWIAAAVAARAEGEARHLHARFAERGPVRGCLRGGLQRERTRRGKNAGGQSGLQEIASSEVRHGGHLGLSGVPGVEFQEETVAAQAHHSRRAATNSIVLRPFNC